MFYKDAIVYVDNCCRYLADNDIKANLIIADPPYNMGKSYSDFEDHWKTRNDYLIWTANWLNLCASSLAPRGSIWLIVPSDVAAYITVNAETELGLLRKQEIIWYYRFGQHMDSKFIPAHTTLLWFHKVGENPVFNPDEILVPSDRMSKYKDSRISESKRKGMRVPLSVWEYSRIQGNNKERWADHPNQLPEQMIARIIKACSNPGDLVLDPFLGSGTTCVVANALQRKSIGIEISPASAESAMKRIKRGVVREFCPIV